MRRLIRRLPRRCLPRGAALPIFGGMCVTVADCVAHLRARAHAEDVRVAARTARIRSLLPRAGAVLRQRFGATEVRLFGSVAGGRPHGESDVDISVRGVASAQQGAAWRALEEIFDCPVDLVRLETASPSLVRMVTEYGEQL